MAALEKKLNTLLSAIEIDDLVTEKKAELLEVNLKALQNRRAEGKFTGRFTYNALGHVMYFRSKMLDASR